MVEQTELKKIAACKVTYFIGKMLAKAGVLVLNNNGLIFIPTTLDKAMGALDIQIPLNEIENFLYDDSFQRKLQIKTPSRTHRFIGSGLKEIHEKLIVLKRDQLQNSGTGGNTGNQPVSNVAESREICFSCSSTIRPDFKFCPNCSTQLKLLCSDCKEAVEEAWYTCPYCGKELKKKEG